MCAFCCRSLCICRLDDTIALYCPEVCERAQAEISLSTFCPLTPPLAPGGDEGGTAAAGRPPREEGGGCGVGHCQRDHDTYALPPSGDHHIHLPTGERWPWAPSSAGWAVVHVTGVRVGEIGGAEFRGQQVLWVLPKALGFFCSFLCFLFWSHLLERHMDLETERVAAPSPSHLLYPSHGGVGG